MNPLFALLNQQAAAGTPSGLEYDEAGNLVGIPVGVPTTPDTPAPVLENRSAPNKRDILAVQGDVAEGQEVSDRRGLFGMKGTLRDVLGVLGDAFLLQSGNAPIYAPRRRQEQISDAWAGASSDPIAAAERVGYYDAAMGQDLLQRAQAAQQTAQANAVKNRVEDRQAFDDATKRISQAYAAVMQNPTPEVAAYALQLARNESETLGIPLERLGVTENMTQDVMRVLAGRGATVSQTMNLPFAERRAAVAEGNLEVARQRLQLGFATLKDREARTRLAEQTLGLKREDQAFDQIMAQLGLSLDVQKEQNRNRSSRPRPVPGSTAAPKRPSVSNW